MIQLEGQTETAAVVSCDIEGDRLTLDRSLTWTDGQGVGLAYGGSAPDLGVFETP